MHTNQIQIRRFHTTTVHRDRQWQPIGKQTLRNLFFWAKCEQLCDVAFKEKYYNIMSVQSRLFLFVLFLKAKEDERHFTNPCIWASVFLSFCLVLAQQDERYVTTRGWKIFHQAMHLSLCHFVLFLHNKNKMKDMSQQQQDERYVTKPCIWADPLAVAPVRRAGLSQIRTPWSKVWSEVNTSCVLYRAF